ncbi:diaminopimelate epimerase [Magnetovibrio blakemorei]|uniref:Diaminopimelate epimerase n=2 Tax=Magnetovibrio blakemorei TaxID=28181 RepID=A0A1E5QAY6_9PROT|nr:diaminopimelate epimerase [Magnetovibrio blakemorei]
MAALDFIKMHGLGNDFVILDGRDGGLSLSAGDVRAISARQRGVGCDQLIVLEPARNELADVFMRIYNPDGSESGACGNATRCVASLLMAEQDVTEVIVETISGLLDCENVGDGLYSVDMGLARLDWRDLPLSHACDTDNLPIEIGPLKNPVGVNMGNPHAVFMVADANAIDLNTFGPLIEHDQLFPERTNVEAVEVLANDRIRMRVWERGAGITQACGSGACAALVATARRGLTGRKADVVLDGGILTIEWMADNNVLMTGPVATSFRGQIDPSLLGSKP